MKPKRRQFDRTRAPKFFTSSGTHPRRNRDHEIKLLTWPKKRGTVELPPRISCRFCHEKFHNFDDLRFHAQLEHTRAFYQVNRSLAQVDAKLRSLEQLAHEGMRGYKEPIIGGKRTYGHTEQAVQRVEESEETA